MQQHRVQSVVAEAGDGCADRLKLRALDRSPHSDVA